MGYRHLDRHLRDRDFVVLAMFFGFNDVAEFAEFVDAQQFKFDCQQWIAGEERLKYALGQSNSRGR
jgi:hypothetical protein